MGFLDNLGGLGKIVDMVSGSKDQGMSLLLIKGLVGKFGGFQGVLDQFGKNGLQDIVKSWLGNGTSNLPVSADQILQVFGKKELDDVSSDLNMKGEEAAGLLSKFLPEIADKASSNGLMGMLDNIDASDIPNLIGKLMK